MTTRPKQVLFCTRITSPFISIICCSGLDRMAFKCQICIRDLSWMQLGCMGRYFSYVHLPRAEICTIRRIIPGMTSALCIYHHISNNMTLGHENTYESTSVRFFFRVGCGGYVIHLFSMVSFFACTCLNQLGGRIVHLQKHENSAILIK